MKLSVTFARSAAAVGRSNTAFRQGVILKMVPPLYVPPDVVVP